MRSSQQVSCIVHERLSGFFSLPLVISRILNSSRCILVQVWHKFSQVYILVDLFFEGAREFILSDSQESRRWQSQLLHRYCQFLLKLVELGHLYLEWHKSLETPLFIRYFYDAVVVSAQSRLEHEIIQ